MKRFIPQVLAWTALLAVSSALALAQSDSTTRTDGQIEMDVVHALDAAPPLKNDLITAATIQGEVTLTGTVTDDASRLLATSITAQVAGVTQVHNNLQIGDPQAAADAGNLNLQSPTGNAQDNAAAGAPPEDNAAPEDNGPPQDNGQPEDQQQDQQAPPPGYDQQPPNQAQSPYPPQPPARGQYAPPPPPDAQESPYPPQPQYTSQPPAPQQAEAPQGPVTIPPGTLLQVRTSEPVDSKRAQEGQPVQFIVIQDVYAGGALAIPRGATVLGVVTEAKKAGTVSGHPELALTLTALDLGRASYPLSTTQFKVRGPSKAHRTFRSALSGGLLGTVVGCAVGRGEGCLIGAGAGVAAGTASSAASSSPGVWIPAEALVDFHLTAPLTVTPVSASEAARLAQGLYPGGPNLYRRGYGPYGQPYPGYPPVYYRPYYATGGYYYWR